MKKIETTVVSVKYLLKISDFKIGVEKNADTGTLSIYRHAYFNQPLVFQESNKETCENIGKLLIAASKL